MITVKLERNDWGQILDGLQQRFDDWQGTANVLTPDGDIVGYISPDEDGFMVQDCNTPEEAQKIADIYIRIIDSIREQMEEQRDNTTCNENY